MSAERNPIVVGQSAIEPPAFPDSHRGLFVATLIFLLLAGIYLRLPTGLFAGERAPLERGQRRVEGLERRDVGGAGTLDRERRDRRVEGAPPGLDFR